MQLSVFWFRRDLRLHDNAGLYHALTIGSPVLPIFIFDSNILDHLSNRADARVAFIHDALEHLQTELLKIGSSLEVYSGTPMQSFENLLQRYDVRSVFANHDYEPYGMSRDKEIASYLKDRGISFHSYKDHVIFEKNEVLKENQQPYLVFTPYSKRWKQQVNNVVFRQYPTEKCFGNFYKQHSKDIPSLQQIGFQATNLVFPSPVPDVEHIRHYHETRNAPALEGTSKLGVHLRFGTVGIRSLVELAIRENQTFLNELIWREFFQMILFHFPHVGEGKSFNRQYELMQWRNNEEEFAKWSSGQTGYPMVDAGMRELNETGFMHNRVRMITASFLCKHLLIDWRWGEAYFAEKLFDFELASNNGNWQWVAGSGVDAAPYFRIFNPSMQAKKFDPENDYIKKWVPEWGSDSYPAPMVNHEEARARALMMYEKMRSDSARIGSLR